MKERPLALHQVCMCVCVCVCVCVYVCVCACVFAHAKFSLHKYSLHHSLHYHIVFTVLSGSDLTEDAVFKSLNILLESSNYPVLVTCKYGRNFSGVIVGCLRKLQWWSLMSIFEEFRRFSGSRQQQHEQFIELFDTELLEVKQESCPPFLKLKS